MSDIKLVIGAQIPESLAQLQKDIAEIVKGLNANPPLIKLKFDTGKGAEGLKAQVEQVSNEAIKAANAVTQANKAEAQSTTAKTQAIKNQEAVLQRAIQLQRQYNTLLEKAKTGGAGQSQNYGFLQSDAGKLEELINGYRRGKVTAEELAAGLNTLKTSYLSNQVALDKLITTDKQQAAAAKETGTVLQRAIQLQQQYNALLNKTGSGAAGQSANYGLLQGDANKLEDLISKYRRGEVTAKELAAAINKLKTSYLSNQVALEQLIATEKKQTAADKEASDTTKKRAQEEHNKQAVLQRAIQLQQQYNNAIAGMTGSRHGVGAGIYAGLSQGNADLAEAITQFKNGSISAETFRQKVDSLSTSYRENTAAVEQLGLRTQSSFKHFSSLAQKFATWFSITRVIMAAYRAFKQMVQASIELETAFNQLQIVTGATDAQMAKFAQNSFELAQNLGKSVTDVTKAIETFSRLGYTLDESSTLAKFATILSNVAAVDLSEATTGLTSIIKGFNLEVTEAEHVADVLINIGQKYAVSAAEMMEAYEKSGAALNATNTSFEKSAALIAAANAAVQNASTSGQALKTISARIRGKYVPPYLAINMLALCA